MKIADIKPIFLPTKIQQVDDKLYRGNAIFSPIKAYRIKMKGVTQVIDLRGKDNIFVNGFKFLEKLYCKWFNIDYVQMGFSLVNNEIPNIDYFKSLIMQIDNGKSTYLHCHYGRHRTGFAVAMYQKAKGVAKDIIFKQLKSYGWNTINQKNNLNIFYKDFLS